MCDRARWFASATNATTVHTRDDVSFAAGQEFRTPIIARSVRFRRKTWVYTGPLVRYWWQNQSPTTWPKSVWNTRHRVNQFGIRILQLTLTICLITYSETGAPKLSIWAAQKRISSTSAKNTGSSRGEAFHLHRMFHLSIGRQLFYVFLLSSNPNRTYTLAFNKHHTMKQYSQDFQW